jgi:hypothetical protein
MTIFGQAIPSTFGLFGLAETPGEKTLQEWGIFSCKKQLALMPVPPGRFVDNKLLMTPGVENESQKVGPLPASLSNLVAIK